MDTEWALRELQSFVEATRLVAPPPIPGVTVLSDDRIIAGNRQEVVGAAQVVEQILDRTLPGWRSSVESDKTGRWQQQRNAALRAIAQIERQEELEEKLGDNAPRLSASTFHPWVWEAARSLWQSSHFREAVRAASVKVNAEVQNKVNRRDVAETDLFNQCFSEDPPKLGAPRLRLPSDDDSKTARSVRRGMRSFAEGCYAGIRNPASHDPLRELAEHEALEQLAAFSILARWIDDCIVLT